MAMVAVSCLFGSALSLSVRKLRFSLVKQNVVKNLQSASGNISKSARLAKRNRTDFYKLLARHRLLAEDFERNPTQRR
jgi:two-component system, NtrC family, response regulator GlrR